MTEAILRLLPPDYPWREQLQYFPCIDSTNDHLRALAKAGAPHGTAVIAGAQTNGHGRLGRSFHSPEGMGVYLSILLRPECAPGELMHLTCATAVAMCDAVEEAAAFRPGIKWTNDLVYGRKKLGGILTELGFTPRGTLSHCIIGIGINCCQAQSDFPEELQSMAASLSMIRGGEVAPAAVAAAMLNALWRMDEILLSQKQPILTRYRRDCITLGCEISLLRGDTVRHGKALDITDDGALVVAFSDGHVEAVNSGEVSIRGMYGYL